MHGRVLTNSRALGAVAPSAWKVKYAFPSRPSAQQSGIPASAACWRSRGPGAPSIDQLGFEVAQSVSKPPGAEIDYVGCHGASQSLAAFFAASDLASAGWLA